MTSVCPKKTKGSRVRAVLMELLVGAEGSTLQKEGARAKMRITCVGVNARSS